MGGLRAHEFFAQDVQSGDGLYLAPEMSGEGERGVKLVMAMLDHLTPPPVQCRVHHHVRAGGHQQVRAERVLADRGTGPRVRAAALTVSRRGKPVPVQ
jgi:hypothetical protein